MGSCKVKSETISKKIFKSVAVKYIGLSHTLNRYFTQALIRDFVTQCIGHLENIISMNYADFSKVDMFHKTIFFLNHHH